MSQPDHALRLADEWESLGDASKEIAENYRDTEQINGATLRAIESILGENPAERGTWHSGGAVDVGADPARAGGGSGPGGGGLAGAGGRIGGASGAGGLGGLGVGGPGGVPGTGIHAPGTGGMLDGTGSFMDGMDGMDGMGDSDGAFSHLAQPANRASLAATRSAGGPPRAR